MNHTLSREIRKRRKALGLTLEEAAAQLEIHPITLRRLEAGSTQPSQSLRLRLQQVLGLKEQQDPEAMPESEWQKVFRRIDDPWLRQAVQAERERWRSTRLRLGLA